LNGIVNSFREAFNLILSFDTEVYGIILLTLTVTVSSTAIASAIAVPAGILIGSYDFYGKRLLVKIIHAFMGLPPVVAGLVVYIILSRNGPLGSLGLLFTPTAMVIAQVVIIIPIITGLSIAAVRMKCTVVKENCKGLGLGKRQTFRLLLHECRYPIFSAILTGYGRAISEVGAVTLVGGNIQYHTRVMTTAIMLETRRGNYDQALAIGIVLISLSFIINSILYRLQEGK